MFNKSFIVNMDLFFTVLDKRGPGARKAAQLVKVHGVQASGSDPGTRDSSV